MPSRRHGARASSRARGQRRDQVHAQLAHRGVGLEVERRVGLEGRGVVDDAVERAVARDVRPTSARRPASLADVGLDGRGRAAFVAQPRAQCLRPASPRGAVLAPHLPACAREGRRRRRRRAAGRRRSRARRGVEVDVSHPDRFPVHEPGAQAPSAPHPLTRIIDAALQRAGGWLPFDRFMALALYAPGLGYYANASRKFGQMPASGSDFVTAPELTPLFGRTLARAGGRGAGATGTDEVWEFGAGSGALAAATARCAGRARARATASSTCRARLRERQQRAARRAWRQGRMAGRRCPSTMRGVVVGNEVLDAMPVQLLAATQRPMARARRGAQARWRSPGKTGRPSCARPSRSRARTTT